MRLTNSLSAVTWALLAALLLVVAGATHAAALLVLPWRNHHDAFTRIAAVDRKSTRLNSSHSGESRMPASA